MRLYLQFGYGMMDHTKKLLGQGWPGSGVVLSPRDLEVNQLQRMVDEARTNMAEPLLDPQCYAHDADHARLVSHEYFKVFKQHSTASLGGAAASDILRELAKLDRYIGVRRHILPGLLANPVNDDWFAVEEATIAAAPAHFGDEPLLATIALSNEAMLDENQIEAVVDRSANWPVAGFYVVGETPTSYLVDHPMWLSNLLVLVSGLKLLKKFVVVGYCSHQMLCLVTTKADVIASGTWLNVRAFPTAKFYVTPDDEVSRRATWYYCPQALSEYKPQFLDLARGPGLLDQVQPDPSLGSNYAAPLFSGAAPSTVNWTEKDAFRHYLTCLHAQAEAAPCGSFQDALDGQRRLLDRAEALLKTLHSYGIVGQDRDFMPLVDVNRAALISLDSARGPRLRRAW